MIIYVLGEGLGSRGELVMMDNTEATGQRIVCPLIHQSDEDVTNGSEWETCSGCKTDVIYQWNEHGR